GFELLVLVGEIRFDGETLAQHDWLRIPAGEAVELSAGDAGARLWIKRGHLSSARIPEQVA
ncbi:MAG: cupin, partial [Pseudomonadota bacterium]|nr:cupin [Pseudomonadota bacterium]